MKMLLAMTLAFATALTANAQTGNENSDLEIAIQTSMRELAQVPKDMLLIDESNKKLARSNQDQTDTTEMLDKQARKLQYEEAPAIDKRIDKLKQKAQELLASGCGADNTTDPELARRCNNANDELKKQHDALKVAQKSLKDRAALIGDGRKAVAASNLKNAAQQKKNNADYNDLVSKKLALFQDVITRSLKIVERQAMASKACASLQPVENASCCLSVVNDGKPARECDIGVEAIFNLFKNGGVFPNR